MGAYDPTHACKIVPLLRDGGGMCHVDEAGVHGNRHALQASLLGAAWPLTTPAGGAGLPNW